jgi:hypothetical protein
LLVLWWSLEFVNGAHGTGLAISTISASQSRWKSEAPFLEAVADLPEKTDPPASPLSTAGMTTRPDSQSEFLV